MSDEQKFLMTPALSEQEIRNQTEVSEDFRTIYCSHVRIAVSNSDFRLFVGETYPIATGKLKIIEHLCLAMTPQQAKATLQILSSTVANFEKQFGSIKSYALVEPETGPSAPPAEPSSS